MNSFESKHHALLFKDLQMHCFYSILWLCELIIHFFSLFFVLFAFSVRCPQLYPPWIFIGWSKIASSTWSEWLPPFLVCVCVAVPFLLLSSSLSHSFPLPSPLSQCRVSLGILLLLCFFVPSPVSDWMAVKYLCHLLYMYDTRCFLSVFYFCCCCCLRPWQGACY